MNRCVDIIVRMLLCGLLLLVVHSAALAKNCRVAISQQVSFGCYDPLQSGNLDTSGLIRIRCSANTPNVSVKLDAGLSGSYQPRYMQSGSALLGYNLFKDASRFTVWGDGTSGTDYFFFTLLDDIDIPIYARTLLGQDVPPGSYSDTVVVTVEW